MIPDSTSTNPLGSRAILGGKRVILGVTGSIAAYKAVALASELVRAGAVVDVIMTDGAQRFVTPLSFQAITHRPVVTELFSVSAELEIGHVSLGHAADVLVIAPATAHALARLAHGLADDALGTTALATRAPLVLAPAMESNMWEHPATQVNVALLRARGALVVGPADGRLASGRTGAGRMVEPTEILDAISAVLAGRPDTAIPRPPVATPSPSDSLHHADASESPTTDDHEFDYAGKHLVVTAGGTREPIDPVRFIGNRSSGKMGYAIAEAARDRGALVTLISGPSDLAPPPGITLVGIDSARDLECAVHDAIGDADILVMAAAVADYRVEAPAHRKIKKKDDQADLVLRLVRNPDILAGLADYPLVKIGFAAETEDLIAHGRDKLQRKRVDMIVANDVTSPGSGFGTDTNQVTLITRDEIIPLPLLSKREVADRILDQALAFCREAPPD